MKESTSKLSNTMKDPEDKTSVLDDRRRFTHVKKTVYSYEKKTEYSGFPTRWKPLLSLKSRMIRMEFAK